MQRLKPLDLGATGNSSIFSANESATRFTVQIATAGGGAPSGAFKVQATNDPNPSQSTALWTDVPAGGIITGTLPAPAGADASGMALFDFVARAYRVVYTRTSGTGTATIDVAFAFSR